MTLKQKVSIHIRAALFGIVVGIATFIDLYQKERAKKRDPSC